MNSGPIVTEIVPCDLCGSDDQDLLYTRLDPITGQEYHLVECNCGMAFVNPMPTAQSIPKLYPADYLKDKQDMTSMYRRMMEFLPDSNQGTLLDIGCGRGDFIAYAAQSGQQVEGIDLMAWDTSHDVPIRVGDFLTMDLRRGITRRSRRGPFLNTFPIHLHFSERFHDFFVTTADLCLWFQISEPLVCERVAQKMSPGIYSCLRPKAWKLI